MAKKNVRVYYTTFIDVVLDEEDFEKEEWEDDSVLTDYVENNASDFITSQEIYENLAIEPLETEISDVDDDTPTSYPTDSDDVKFCPDCGEPLIFDGYNYDTAHLDYHCEHCGWYGVERDLENDDEDDDY